MRPRADGSSSCGWPNCTPPIRSVLATPLAIAAAMGTERMKIGTAMPVHLRCQPLRLRGRSGKSRPDQPRSADLELVAASFVDRRNFMRFSGGSIRTRSQNAISALE